MLNFPTSPEIDQIYPPLEESAVEGRRWQWDGQVWAAYASEISGGGGTGGAQADWDATSGASQILNKPGVFTGITIDQNGSYVDGTVGLVPAPQVGGGHAGQAQDSGKFLKSDGTWGTPEGGGGSVELLGTLDEIAVSGDGTAGYTVAIAPEFISRVADLEGKTQNVSADEKTTRISGDLITEYVHVDGGEPKGNLRVGYNLYVGVEDNAFLKTDATNGDTLIQKLKVGYFDGDYLSAGAGRIAINSGGNIQKVDLTGTLDAVSSGWGLTDANSNPIGLNTDGAIVCTNSTPMPLENFVIDWNSVINKPNIPTLDEHTHEISDVNGLQAALDAAGSGGTSLPESYAEIESKTQNIDLGATVAGQTKINGAFEVYADGGPMLIVSGTAVITNMDGGGNGLLNWGTVEARTIDIFGESYEGDPDGTTKIGIKTDGAIVCSASEPRQIVGFVIDWGSVINTPTAFAPETHTHSISEIEGLQSALDNAGGGIPVASDSYTEPTFTNGLLTSMTTWSDSTKAVLVRTKTFSYTAERLTQITTTDGAGVTTMTKTINYAGDDNFASITEDYA
jgi:hypothetical protein